MAISPCIFKMIWPEKGQSWGGGHFPLDFRALILESLEQEEWKNSQSYIQFQILIF